MNREDFQVLTELRMKEAEILIENHCFAGAYYLLGYVIECALKSCIAKQFREHDFPDLKLVRDSYTHNIEQLINVSGLKQNLTEEQNRNRQFKLNWNVVVEWSEQARYQREITEFKTKEFYQAVTKRDTGVLTWLKNWW